MPDSLKVLWMAIGRSFFEVTDNRKGACIGHARDIETVREIVASHNVLCDMKVEYKEKAAKKKAPKKRSSKKKSHEKYGRKVKS